MKSIFFLKIDIQCGKKNVVFAFGSGWLISDNPFFQVTIERKIYFLIFSVTTNAM